MFMSARTAMISSKRSTLAQKSLCYSIHSTTKNQLNIWKTAAEIRFLDQTNQQTNCSTFLCCIEGNPFEDNTFNSGKITSEQFKIKLLAYIYIEREGEWKAIHVPGSKRHSTQHPYAINISVSLITFFLLFFHATQRIAIVLVHCSHCLVWFVFVNFSRCSRDRKSNGKLHVYKYKYT